LFQQFCKEDGTENDLKLENPGLVVYEPEEIENGNAI
jgi:hypothetical protein